MKGVWGIPDHKFTLEESRKGGHTSSPFKTLARGIANRKKCSVTCMFFEQCPANAMSLGYRNPNKPEEDQKCMMKEFPPTVRQQFINMFLTGEEGIIHQIKILMHNYLNDVEAYGTLHDKRDSLQLMIVLYDKLYNHQRKGIGRKEPLTITIRRVGMEPEVMEIKPRGMLPEGIKTKDIVNPLNQDITEGDPESLINSPLMDTLIRVEKPQSRPLFMEEIKITTNIEDILEENDGN